jgi:hypothetical protein
MSFYKEISPYFEYLHSIRRLKGYLSFDMKFPIKWLLPKSVTEEGQIVGFQSDDENFKGISFVSQMSEDEVKSTLSKIDKIIKLNIEREMKDRLFKQTIEQLKQTFEKNDLDKLQNLYFDFESEQTILDNNENESTTIELAE